MSLLVFVDDDESERQAMEKIATNGGYDFAGIAWPPTPTDPFDKFKDKPPDLFVLDLYLPPRDGTANERISSEQSAVQSVMAAQVAKRFSKLYDEPVAGREKAMLRATMGCLSDARELLDSQWSAMGQHPNNGIELLRYLLDKFPQVPVIFYSRKLTPEDVIRVLRAGAVDAIRKGALSDQNLLRRLKRAHEQRSSIVNSDFEV